MKQKKKKIIRWSIFSVLGLLSSFSIMAPTIVLKYTSEINNDYQNHDKESIKMDDTNLIKYINSINESNKTQANNDFSNANILETISKYTNINSSFLKKVYVSQGNNTDDNRYSISLSIVLNDQYIFDTNLNYYNLIDIETQCYDISNSIKENYTINNGVLESINDSLKNEKVLYIPNGVTTIGAINSESVSMFKDFVNLETIYLPNTLTNINKNAFLNTTLKTIYIPYSVKSIGYAAFKGCSSLKSVVFDNNTSLTSIPGSAFENSGIENVVFPENISTFNYSFLKGTQNLKTVTILNNNPSFKNPSTGDNNTNTFFSSSSQRTFVTKFFVNNDSVKNQLKSFYSVYTNSTSMPSNNTMIQESDITIIGSSINT